MCQCANANRPAGNGQAVQGFLFPVSAGGSALHMYCKREKREKREKEREKREKEREKERKREKEELYDIPTITNDQNMLLNS